MFEESKLEEYGNYWRKKRNDSIQKEEEKKQDSIHVNINRIVSNSYKPSGLDRVPRFFSKEIGALKFSL